MRLVKLTNAATSFKGKPLLLNAERVVSVFEAEIDGEKVTFVYADTKDSWQVKEDIVTVSYLLQNMEPPIQETKTKKVKKDV